ncbi:MAG: hypothetical protein JRN21_09605 [Nitrososphaerota archaeon]|nr:hypothetical protein [Nitrososphaerota archaeon]
MAQKNKNIVDMQLRESEQARPRKPALHQVPSESWVDLFGKIEEAKATLVFARMKIRSDRAMFNFSNFVRGFVIYVDALAQVDASLERKMTDFGDVNNVKLMARSTMLIYGRCMPREKGDGDWTPVSTIPYAQVRLPEWEKGRDKK